MAHRPTFAAFLREINDEAAITPGPITKPPTPEPTRPHLRAPRIGDVSPVTPRVEHHVARHVYLDFDRRRPMVLADLVA